MNNLIIKRSQLVEAQFTGTPAIGKKYAFTQVPNISRNNIIIYGFECHWYFMGDLPEELKKYKSYPVHIEYEDKDIFKTKYKSLRWSPIKKNWLCNETDYKAITA